MSIFVAILGHIGLPQSGNVAACVLGPNNNKAIIRFYPYDDHQDRGACQIWKVILESRHCVHISDHAAAVNFHISTNNLKF